NTKEAIDFFSEELRIFCQSLMDAFSVRITDDGLRKAIAFSNGKRQMLKNIYILKKDDLPIVSGEEVFSIILQSMMGGKGEQGLSEVLEEIRCRKKADKRPVRVMLIGTEIHDPGIFGAIEGKGEAIVVADTLCTGSRYIWEDVEEDGDPLRAIARHYLFGVNCPLKHPHDRAIAQVEEFIEQFNVEKAIFIWPEACDPMGWIVPFIKDTLDSRGIPSCWITIRGDGSNEDRLEVSREASKFLRGQLTW
ncbi:MAG: 2-hydroxyacyl-CoA dehydratase family protein, partial [Candidatus Bathyarchaeia archaeon]